MRIAVFVPVAVQATDFQRFAVLAKGADGDGAGCVGLLHNFGKPKCDAECDAEFIQIFRCYISASY